MQLKQINPNRVFVKPNFVNNDDSIMPKKNRENQFVFVGRLDKLKGIDLLFETWKKMGDTATRLIVCGTGPMERWCKDFLERNKVNIIFRGLVSNKEARELIAVSRALILPTQWYEGFPMTIVEAFSVGTPVICSDLGNAGNIITDGVDGIKFQNTSVDSLIQAIEQFEQSDIELLEKNAYIKYKNYFKQDINYEMLNKVYLLISHRSIT